MKFLNFHCVDVANLIDITPLTVNTNDCFQNIFNLCINKKKILNFVSLLSFVKESQKKVLEHEMNNKSGCSEEVNSNDICINCSERNFQFKYIILSRLSTLISS